jgi:hypothetical protein
MAPAATATAHAESTATPRAKLTHFVPYDAIGKRLARAYCGKLVRPDHDHSLEPTCESCAEQQAMYDRTVF